MLQKLQIPPGQFGNGTLYQAKGRWARSQLVRWFSNTVRPMMGWLVFSSATLSGKGRCIHSWLADDGAPWLAVGTHTKLYALSGAGTVTDITPSGLTAGEPDATSAGGYGGGDFGAGLYGTARPDDGGLTPATVWSLDNFGQILIGCNGADGKIYGWDVNTSVHATLLDAAAPTGVRALVVTEEGFIFALGVGSSPRSVAWPDQIDYTNWTPGEPSQAGSYSIQTNGKLMAGVRVRGATLIFTDTDAHLATYLGLPLIYSFQRVGTGCGLISQKGFASCGDTLVAWMGEAGFWVYNGAVQPLPCDVQDAVFGDFNTFQRSKVSAYHEPAYGEVTWFYPSAGSDENDSYVRYNYRENHWARGEPQEALARLAGVGRGGGFSVPFLVNDSGDVLQAESGFSFDGFTPYAETGPLELGDGDMSANVMGVIPDESELGDVRRTFYGSFSPTGTETTHGPYTSANPINTRFQARQFRLKVEFPSGSDARYGNDRLDIMPGGGRR